MQDHWSQLPLCTYTVKVVKDLGILPNANLHLNYLISLSLCGPSHSPLLIRRLSRGVVSKRPGETISIIVGSPSPVTNCELVGLESQTPSRKSSIVIL